MDSLFLHDDEVRELTGADLKSLQVAWLKERHWIFETTRSGHPRVLRAYCETKMGLTKRKITSETSQVTAPNFS